MADYYSLLARAVAALPQSAPQTRQAVYERARKALFNQLRSIQPPVAEEDIEAEGRALDEAIARLELEVVREQSGREPTAAPAPKETRAPEQERKEPAKSAEPAALPPAAPKPEKLVFAEKATPAEKPAPADEAPTQPQRPPAPLPPLPEPASVSRRVIVIGGVLAAVVALVAVLALQFRERPEDLAKLQPEPAPVESEEGGKLADRIGGDSDAAPPSRTPSEQRSQPVAVAQKAELWVAAPEEAAKVKTFPGTVVWRLDSMPAGPGEPVSPAIRGEIDFPTAKLKTTIVIQKNLDPTLSASHTVNLSFSLGPGNELKRVKAIGPMQMRRPEAQSGEQVAGVPVPITDNAFLIGLLRGNREARNVVLLRAPMVLDLPMQLEDGRAATISLEKGPGGERVFADALDAWSK
ncbi:hypothetical protein MSC49_29440 [Methylosinus sp. C49]|uniref:hypothetical protein n=1 Tax=Methylosinus sp. C49 TaxID=2699395 RepID=UPI0013677410|nr:hypothetical protein [Methylosinus sp. C49]BBU63009.1 hypothetical protein MSC49_29440 [Methylosinus sp. C49]